MGFQSWRPKIFLSENQKLWYFRTSRLDKRGVRVVTNAGRDAMDAEVPLTSGAEADGEIVWSWRRDAGVKSAEVIPPATVAKEPFTGEHV